MSGFADIYAGMERLERQIREAGRRGLHDSIPLLESDAKASGAYNDQTGATRASTVAFIVTEGDGGSDRAEAALAAGEALNPGHGTAEEITLDNLAETDYAILTAMMDYDKFLEIKNAGAHAVIEPAMTQQAGQVAARVFAAIRLELGE